MGHTEESIYAPQGRPAATPLGAAAIIPYRRIARCVTNGAHDSGSWNSSQVTPRLIDLVALGHRVTPLVTTILLHTGKLCVNRLVCVFHRLDENA